MAKISAMWAKPLEMLRKMKGTEIDTSSLRTASVLMLIGVIQVYAAYGYGTPIAESLLKHSRSTSEALWFLRIIGFLSSFTGVLGLVTANKEKMIDVQIILGLVQVFLLDCCIALHWGMALVGGLIPYAASVMFVNAAEHKRSLIETAENKAGNNKVYTGCVLLLVLILPLGVMLSNLLAIYSHSFFVQKSMVTFGMILYVYTAAVAALGFYLGDRVETRLIFKLLVGIHCGIFLVALFVAYLLYSSLDQSGMLLAVGILAVGIGVNLMGVAKWN